MFRSSAVDSALIWLKSVMSCNTIACGVEIGCVCYLCDIKIHLITNMMVVFVLYLYSLLLLFQLNIRIYAAPLVIVSRTL